MSPRAVWNRGEIFDDYILVIVVPVLLVSHDINVNVRNIASGAVTRLIGGSSDNVSDKADDFNGALRTHRGSNDAFCRCMGEEINVTDAQVLLGLFQFQAKCHRNHSPGIHAPQGGQEYQPQI